MATITINGNKLEVPDGITVLRAAQSAGIQIPTLCDHPHLTPYGGCRLCLVEVEGARTLQPSCTLPVSNNMVVKTDTKKVLDARQFVLTLIFSERNHFCPYCQVSGGDCQLQNSAYNEGMTHWPLQPNYQPYPMDASHPYIILENNRCILCRRCVRACGELIGNYTLGFEERGAKSILVADTGVPLGESTCVSCGSCVQVCPTGALIDRWSAYRGRETQVDITNSICVGCSVGCKINVLTRDNSLVRIDGDWDAEMNEGVICEVGRFAPMKDKCERISTPLIRKNGSLKAATWDEALNTIAAQFKALSGKATDGVAAVISTKQPIEAIYSFKQLFSDKLGSEMVTSSEEGAFTTAASAFADSNNKSFEGTLKELQNAGSVMVMDVNLSKNHQVAGFFIKRKLAMGTNLLVVDRHENELSKVANKTIQSLKGTNTDTLKALTAAILKLGLSKGKTSLKASDLESFATATGLKTDDYLDAAYVLAASENPVIVYDNIADFAALKELADLVNAKLIGIKGDANSFAAAQLHLEKPLKVNGHKAAFFVVGDDETSQKSIKEFEKTSFRVVLASYASALTGIADVVMPSFTWLEQEGHYVRLDGKLQEAKQSIKPPDEVMSTVQVMNALAEKLGYKLSGEWSKEIHKRVPTVEISK
ncbi:MAG: molybdopterin-dependent oxidoreductase [Chloroflexi bacterium]|nr:molybdopterin-dependent oxidoreductase [Chloroflexota bacterium]